MYLVIRTAQAGHGKLGAATKWAKEMADYLNSHYPQVRAQAYEQLFGDHGAIYWTMEYSNLEEHE